jgi:hypothetical protein
VIFAVAANVRLERIARNGLAASTLGAGDAVGVAVAAAGELVGAGVDDAGGPGVVDGLRAGESHAPTPITSVRARTDVANLRDRVSLVIGSPPVSMHPWCFGSNGDAGLAVPLPAWARETPG